MTNLRKGVTNVWVSEKAIEVMKEYLKDTQDPKNIRIMMSEVVAGPSLGMALDEPKENDEVFDKNGLKFLINKELLDAAKPINVEFGPPHTQGQWFSVTSALTNKDSGCGSCSC